jgi:phage tail sheath protein FI
LNGGGTADPYLSLTGDYPNKSKYVRVEVLNKLPNYLDENGDIRQSGSVENKLPGLNSGSFTGGSDGHFGFDANGNFTGDSSAEVSGLFYENIAANNIQGYDPNAATDGKQAYEDAISLLGNADEYDINLVLMPGISDSAAGTGAALVTKALNMCEDRGDCFVVADPGLYSQSPTTATAKAEARDSSYGAMYYPWIQIADPDLSKNVWVPPSTIMGGIYAFNDKVAHPWFAPAGLNRGGLDMAIQAERKLTHSNRDTLYDSNVNPIATFPGQGVTVWGQKTLQKKMSALDRINVRRLLIKVKKFIASTSRFLVFEQNSAATRKRFLSIANPYLEQVQSNAGLNAFRVVMDETNNTPDLVDRNILYGQIFLQPTRTAEFIVLDFTVQPTGATFPE